MKIKLLAEHRHDGVNHANGTVLDVPTETGEWLISIGKAEAA
jgi:hypothetical protein